MVTLAGTDRPPAALSRLQRLRGPLLTGGLLLAAAAALHVRDPHLHGSWGFCPWLALTGWSCPACGGLRAVNDLTHGDLPGAASSNLVLVVLLPLVGFLYVRWLGDAWSGLRRPRSLRTRHLAVTALAVVLVVFAIARNLPFGGWLAP